MKARAVTFVAPGGSSCGRSRSPTRPRASSWWPPSGPGSRAVPSCSPTGARSTRPAPGRDPRRPGRDLRLPRSATATAPSAGSSGRPAVPGGAAGVRLPPAPGPVRGRRRRRRRRGRPGPAGRHLYPLVETAVQVSLDGGPRLGETAVVVGLGAVGVLVAALLAAPGRWCSDPSRSRPGGPPPRRSGSGGRPGRGRRGGGRPDRGPGRRPGGRVQRQPASAGRLAGAAGP